jgi:ubiquinone/menaquinone biosynthesis C-methylase UbiE
MPATFDPETWNRTCESEGGRGFVFRRGAELAFELSRKLIQPGQRWLDVGCGTGQLVRALRETGVSVVGADFDRQMIAFARKKTPGPLAVARAEQIPFGDATMDGVVAISLMGCVLEARPIFAEIRRVLRADGHAVMTFTSRDSWLLKLNYVLSRHREGGYRLYNASEVIRELEKNGFWIVEVRFYNFVFCAGNLLLPPPSLARRLECSRSYRLARNFIVVARRCEQP